MRHAVLPAPSVPLQRENRRAVASRLSRSDLEAFWPGRRPDAFDGLCPGAAPPVPLEPPS